MLTIIISYNNSDSFRNVSANIAETCGVDHEIIGFYNPGKYSLTAAYNLGAARANYPYVLLVHDDVRFHTKEWGKIIMEHLSDLNTGVIGIAGGNYVPKAPSGWFIKKNNLKNDRKELAIMLDGVFLAMSKKNFDALHFDEDIKGFHGYDTEISLNAAKSFNNYIIKDILIEHFSSGNPDKVWLDNNIQIRNKHGHQFQKHTDPELDTIAFERFIRNYFKYYDINFKNIFSSLRYYPRSIGLKNNFYLMILYLKFIKLGLSKQTS
ncbi:hypothetical protein EIH07_02155 [Chryseobacterium taklimakanense]|uniref:glycosyltransferase n=1 Tax=Chryseobacterium taklimakanense TaxID=536441 RepID=UPI000F5EC695|nr:glycosyltransferase [Chryseobacterium taklimakanense]AZI21926.1 hypothetical protein EIH07_02155 [Chryseobacterium taklimakanense]